MKKLPLLLLLIALVAVLYFELHSYLTFDMLKEHHAFLLEWNKQHPVFAALIFIGLYIAAVSLSLPVAIYFNVTAGFLFGVVWGTLYAVMASVIGAVIIFFAVSSAFGAWFESQAQGWVRVMEEGFKRNAFNYLLTLRLIPVIPFWVTNIAAALLDVRLRTFALATLLGVIPETTICTWMGSGLEHAFKAGQNPNFEMFFVPSIYVPFIMLAMLPLIPLIYKKLKPLLRPK